MAVIPDQILKRFQTIQQNGRLAHAYLFAGPEHSGKSQTALMLAKMLNCEQVQDYFFCDQCSSCIKINTGQHPDVLRLEVKVGETIKIDDIRSCIQRLQLRSFEAKIKVFILTDAHTLTVEAANALLKTLEEPAANTLMILTTHVRELCLDTIQSRCQLIQFFANSDEAVCLQLMERLKLDIKEAKCLAFFAQGSFDIAEQLNQKKFMSKKNKVIDEIIMKRNSDEFLRKALSDKEETQTMLRVLLSFVRDLVFLKSGVGEKYLVHQDRLREMHQLLPEFSADQLHHLFEQIVKAYALFKDHLNVKMALSIFKELVWVK